MDKEIEKMPPQKTWFFSDSSGRIFPTNEKEAYELLTNTSRWRRQDIKMLGCSDGLTYHKTIEESKETTKILSEKISILKEALTMYIKGHDRLMFEEFLDEKDERVIRAKTLIATKQKELEPLENELKDIRKTIIQKAFDAELEQAKGNMQNPQDFSVIAKSDGTVRGDNFMQQFKQARRVI